MEKLITELNNFTNNYYDFLLKSALLDVNADFCVIEISYKDGIILSLKEKSKIEQFLNTMLPKEFKYDIKFIKRYVSEDYMKQEVEDYLHNNFPSVTFKIEFVKLEDKCFEIKLIVDKLSSERFAQKKCLQVLKEYFEKKHPQFTFKFDSSEQDFGIDFEAESTLKNEPEEETDIFANRKIVVSNVVEIVGEKFEDLTAVYIMDHKTAKDLVVFAGKIKKIKPVILKPRKSKNSDEETNEEVSQPEAETGDSKYQRKLYKFSLADFTGEIECVFFSNKENQSKLEKLDVDSQIIVRGELAEDSYSGGIVLKIKDIAYCKLPETFEEYIEYKKEKENYEFVFPEKIVTYAQDDLMSFSAEKQVPDYLAGKTFVCYDFETTGLHYETGDRIIEIGAVKIENGKITEKFMSYVNPEKHIPAESSAISGIVDEDVVSAPIADQVLQDFYKFTRNSIIIGYNNINFDNVFLLGQGKTARWNFDNDTDDVFRWAQKYVKNVKNYKLKTIADKLGVTLDNAHRAVFDALATAQVFIKIHEMYNNDIKIK